MGKGVGVVCVLRARDWRVGRAPVALGARIARRGARAVLIVAGLADCAGFLLGRSGEAALVALLRLDAAEAAAARATAALLLAEAKCVGAVLAFFLLTPFTKMAHGFYRMACVDGSCIARLF